MLLHSEVWVNPHRALGQIQALQPQPLGLLLSLGHEAGTTSLWSQLQGVDSGVHSEKASFPDNHATVKVQVPVTGLNSKLIRHTTDIAVSSQHSLNVGVMHSKLTLEPFKSVEFTVMVHVQLRQVSLQPRSRRTPPAFLLQDAASCYSGLVFTCEEP